MGYLQDARAVWKTLVIIITPIVLIPLALPGTSQESKCSYVLVIMAVYWITESLPLAVTALLPVLFLPLLGVMPSSKVCQIYIKDVIFLLLGGLVVAIAIEESNLHKRFALRLLLLLGVQPRKLLLGFMLSTAFLSMWITNTATTAMMTPIARALLSRLFIAQRQHRHQTRRLHDGWCVSTLAIYSCYTTSTGPFAGGRFLDRCPKSLCAGEVLKCLRVYETEFSWPLGSNDDVAITAMEKGMGIDNGRNETRDVEPQKDTGADDTKKDENIATKQNFPNKSAQGKELTDDKDSLTDDDDDDDGEIDLNMDNLDEASAKLVKALCLGVCYSANIGGVGTLTGTGPNMVYKNYVESLSEGADQVSFVSWMAFGLPVAVVNLAVSWAWIQLFYFGVKNTLLCRRQTRPEEDRALEQYLRREHRKLGNMSFAEKVVLGHFLVLVLLWITRSPGVFTGWSVLFPERYVSDAVPAVLVALSLFVFPREKPTVFCCRGNRGKQRSVPSVVQWSPLSKKFPWGVLLLLGGGFALAEATKVSGLSNLIAEQMMVIGSFPTWVACAVVVIVTSVTTEITSNTVIATLLLPILAQVAGSMGLHPIYFMLPATVASSFAFMLPVATPPNAIVFAYGDVKVLDMVKTGIALNVICISVVTIAINTFGYAYLNLSDVPDWALTLAQTTPLSVLNTTSTPSAMFTDPSMNMYEMSTAEVSSFVRNVTDM